MALVSIKIDNRGAQKFVRRLQALGAPMRRQDAKLAAKNMEAAAKKLIAKGKSPIDGSNFGAYRGSYAKRIRAGKISGKRLKPVNLKVTGKFLKQYKGRPTAKNGVALGFKSNTGNVQRIEKGHREGANNQAKRPIVPIGGEGLAKQVIIEFTKIILKRIRQITTGSI